MSLRAIAAARIFLRAAERKIDSEECRVAFDELQAATIEVALKTERRPLTWVAVLSKELDVRCEFLPGDPQVYDSEIRIIDTPYRIQFCLDTSVVLIEHDQSEDVGTWHGTLDSLPRILDFLKQALKRKTKRKQRRAK